MTLTKTGQDLLHNPLLTENPVAAAGSVNTGGSRSPIWLPGEIPQVA